MPDVRDAMVPPQPEIGSDALSVRARVNDADTTLDLNEIVLPPRAETAVPPLQWHEKFHRVWNEFREPLGKTLRRIRWPGGFAGWVLGIGGGLGAAVVLVSLAFVLTLASYKPNLPFDRDLYTLNRPIAFIFQDGAGRTLGRRGAVTGDRVHLSEVPAYLPAAFLAMEDRRFYEHNGIDYYGLARAFYVNYRAGRIVQGGSTITQQLAKTIFLSPERSIERKLEEMAAARELEARFSKDQILELYLNRIYLGSGAYGVDGAARVYFGKSARNVTLAEAAMLASLTKAPSVFSPRRDLAAAQARASRVLNAMVETGVITQAQAAQARARPATILDRTQNVARNYFFDYAAEEAQRLVPAGSGDLVIVTTMDPKMQDAARNSIVRVLGRSWRRSRVSQAALVAMNTDGAVRAIIGGRNYAESPFNRATQARRQPGSAFKPFVYLAAFENGLGPHTLRSDEPVDFGGYMPANYGRSHSGAMTLHQALVHSVNTIAVQLGMEVGPSTVAAVAARLGIVSPLQPYASIALGTSEVAPIELTAAFAAFPTGGMRVVPYTVVEIRGIDGRVLYRRTPQEQQRVVENEKALWMNELLYDVTQSGTGRAARVPRHEVAGKTGTTSGFKDAWFVGYSADLVTGVWVGNDNSRPMRRVTGGTLPAQIWSGFMRTALAGRRPLPIPRSEPPPPEIDIAYMNPWGFGATSDDASPVIDDDVADAGERNIGHWWFESADSFEFTPPPRRERMANRRALPPRAVQEGDGDWVGDTPASRENAPETRRNRLRTHRETEPHESDDRDNLGRNHAKRHPSRSRAGSPYHEVDDDPRPRTAWNPPPSNAVEAPPDAPPPREAEGQEEDSWYRYE